jgi:hypothetical protein
MAVLLFRSIFPNPGSRPVHLSMDGVVSLRERRRTIGTADMAIDRWFVIASLELVLLLAEPMARADADAALNLPDAPRAAAPQPSGQTDTPSATGQSGSQTSPAPSKAPPLTPEEQRKKAQEQLKQEEKQRVWAVVATFNTTANQEAIPLSKGQKYQLFFKSAFDPWPFLLAAVLAGTNQAQNSFPEWGQGVQGYAKRFGASYGDYFIGNFLGNAVLASALHEDPRYYQKGTGSYTRRALWAASGTVWCKRDSGTWGPNYANFVGNLMGAAVSNVYYPASDRTVGGTITRGLSVTAQGIIGSEVIEFWPDIVRHHQRKQAEKLAKKNGLPTAQPAAQPSSPTNGPPQF